MSNTSPIMHDVQDDDLLLIFRIPSDGVRRKPIRTEWRTLKNAILAAQPTVKGEPGSDAFQVAVAAGYQGTRAQWLASLSGAPGVSPTLSIGTVKSLPAGSTPTLVNSGTSTKVVLDFGIPAGSPGAPGTPRRVERYTGTVIGTAGVASITFSSAFAAPPLGDIVTTWDGTQMVTGQVTATTTTTATVKVMKSQGTLLLNASVFVVAPAGTVVTIQVIGN